MTRPERVLQIHTRYRRRGGEDAVVEAERRLLEGAGIVVDEVLFDNAEIDERGPTGRLRSAATAVWSRAAARRVARAIDTRRPDVVHVHNTFAAASGSIYRAAMSRGVPIVQTLHNYRFVCPAGTAFRDGRPCTECVGRRVPWPAVAHGSYRGSRSQSAVAALALTVPRLLGIVDRGIDAYLALTSFQRDLMVRGGLPAGRIRVVPNFLEPDPGVTGGARAGVLFAGRLDVEKGVHVLVDAAKRVPGRVRLIGDGPLRPVVETAAAAGVLAYLGPLPHDRVLAEMRRSTAMVLPSIWFEGLPMAIVESYATGTPVIASQIGGLAEIVIDGETGLLAEPGDLEGLAERISWVQAHAKEARQLGSAARQRYLDAYRGGSHLAELLSVYEEVMRAPHARRV
jgi:glycosyltransferase involved in cell wall biosynthesis